MFNNLNRIRTYLEPIKNLSLSFYQKNVIAIFM